MVSPTAEGRWGQLVLAVLVVAWRGAEVGHGQPASTNLQQDQAIADILSSYGLPYDYLLANQQQDQWHRDTKTRFLDEDGREYEQDDSAVHQNQQQSAMARGKGIYQLGSLSQQQGISADPFQPELDNRPRNPKPKIAEPLPRTIGRKLQKQLQLLQQRQQQADLALALALQKQKSFRELADKLEQGDEVNSYEQDETSLVIPKKKRPYTLYPVKTETFSASGQQEQGQRMPLDNPAEFIPETFIPPLGSYPYIPFLSERRQEEILTPTPATSLLNDQLLFPNLLSYTSLPILPGNMRSLGSIFEREPLVPF